MSIDTDLNSKKTILVVDDDEMCVNLLEVILNKYYNVVTKRDGQEAFDYICNGNYPDLILLDVEMPKMNGRVFVRRVKHDSRYAKIPIFFVTAINNPQINNAFQQLGVQEFIFKPINSIYLLERIKNFFDSNLKY